MIRTRRWNDPAEAGDGFRLLICRYRPSRELHAAVYKDGIGWEEYRARFLAEMDSDAVRFRLRALANRVAAGETITLLCSSACVDEARCHRSILRQLVLEMTKRR